MANQLDLRSVRAPVQTSGDGVIFSWSAPEYEQYKYKPAWFLSLGALALALVILGIFSRNYFFVTFVVLALGVLVMYARRAPRTIEGEITRSGVRMGKTAYPFTELKSFWVFDLPGARELSLETKKALPSSVRIPLGSTDPEKIRRIVAQFLPEEEHKIFMTDHIARKLGL